jgi:DNA-binding NtrC family response regulator
MSTVLVIDDEDGIRILLSRWLSDEGYDVRVAADADAGLDEMTRAAADVVMCDVKMPGHDGLWLAEQLRQRFPASAIVLATGLATVPPTTSFKAGVTDYLVKPFERARVVRAVADAVLWHDAAPERAPPTANHDELLAGWIDGA